MSIEKVEFVKVISSNIDFVGFLENKLYIGFLGGGVYAYADANKELFEGMISAPSVGKFFHAFIRTKLPFEKLSIPEGVSLKFKIKKEASEIGNVDTKLK